MPRSLFSARGRFAQELPRIAVYVTGNVGEDEKKALGTRMLVSLINSKRYKGIERSNSFLAEVEKEQVKQRSGEIDDSQIRELGKQFGVQFVCIADITPAYGSFQVSARIVNVETAEVDFIGDATSPLKTIDDLTLVSGQVVNNMFGGQITPKPKPEPKLEPTPEPAAVIHTKPEPPKIEPKPEPEPANIANQEKFETGNQTQQTAPAPKVRKYDGYFAARYALPIGGMPSWGAINLEGGWIWGNGTFFGIDIDGGYGDVYFDNGGRDWKDARGGLGFNLGSVYDLPIESAQLVYGGGIGFWVTYKQIKYGTNKTSYDFLAPFIKLRYKFVELSYRGLLGIYEYNSDPNKFGWNNNQIMLGVYFETSDRVRK